MKRLILILSVLSSLVLVLAFGAYWIFENKLKNQILPQIKNIIAEQTNLKIDFSEFHFSFRELLKLEPAIRISDLKIENAVKVKKIYLSLELKALLDRKFVIKEILVDEADLSFSENSKKEFELKGIGQDKLQKATNQTKTAEEQVEQQEVSLGLLESFSLSKLRLRDSIIQLFPYASSETIKLSNIRAKLDDFTISLDNKIESELDFKANILGKNSFIHVKGHLGPFAPDFKVLPINGNQTLQIHIKDIPEQIIKENFGSMLQSEADSDLIANMTIKGDLAGTLYGAGKLKLNDFILGENKKHNLVANSEIPLSFNLRANDLNLESKNAEIVLSDSESHKGKLNFSSKVYTNLLTGYASAKTTGSLDGLELKSALACFANTQNLVAGNFELPNFNFSFAGNNAQELEKSFAGTAKIIITEGKIAILEKLKDYKTLTALAISNGSKLIDEIGDNFSDMKADMRITNKNLYLTNIDIDVSKKVKVYGKGDIRDGQWLVFDTFLKLPSLNPIPVKIRGSVDKPTVYPDLKAITKKQTGKIVGSFLEYGLNLLKKEAKPAPNQSAEPQAGTKQLDKSTSNRDPQAGLRNIFGQVLKDALIEEPKPKATANGSLQQP